MSDKNWIKKELYFESFEFYNFRDFLRFFLKFYLNLFQLKTLKIEVL